MSVCWREETEKEKKTKLPYFFPTSLTLTDRVFVRVLVCVSEWVSVCLFVLSFVPLLWSKKLRHTDTWTRELATPATAAAAATTAIGSTLLSLFFTFSLLLLLLFFSSHFQCNLQVPAVTNNLSERKRKTVTKKKEKNCSGGKKRQPRRLRHSRGHVLTHGEILSICVLLLLSAVVVVSCCFCCCFWHQTRHVQLGWLFGDKCRRRRRVRRRPLCWHCCCLGSARFGSLCVGRSHYQCRENSRQLHFMPH